MKRRKRKIKEKKGEKRKVKRKKKRKGRKERKGGKQKGGGKSVRGGEKKKEKGFDSRCFDDQKLVRELKLVYSTRATSRCQKTKEVEFSPTLVSLNLMAVSFSPNHETEFLDVETVFRDNFLG